VYAAWAKEYGTNEKIRRDNFEKLKKCKVMANFLVELGSAEDKFRNDMQAQSEH
jgi:hypothetical protein